MRKRYKFSAALLSTKAQWLINLNMYLEVTVNHRNARLR